MSAPWHRLPPQKPHWLALWWHPTPCTQCGATKKQEELCNKALGRTQAKQTPEEQPAAGTGLDSSERALHKRPSFSAPAPPRGAQSTLPTQSHSPEISPKTQSDKPAMASPRSPPPSSPPQARGWFQGKHKAALRDPTGDGGQLIQAKLGDTSQHRWLKKPSEQLMSRTEHRA